MRRCARRTKTQCSKSVVRWCDLRSPPFKLISRGPSLTESKVFEVHFHDMERGPCEPDRLVLSFKLDEEDDAGSSPCACFSLAVAQTALRMISCCQRSVTTRVLHGQSSGVKQVSQFPRLRTVVFAKILHHGISASHICHCVFLLRQFDI